MDPKTKEHFESKAQLVRADLKKWENDWADWHDGSKPQREDIKKNPHIAGKYREYNKLRDVLSGKIAPPLKTASPARKCRSSHALAETPQKKPQLAETPSRNQPHNSEYMGSPAISRKLFSPKPLASLGPTPQRDGRVLGLFDLLVEKELGSPSGKNLENSEPARMGRAEPLATPSKRRGSFTADDEDMAKLGRTPMSSSKRQRLNYFMTPLKKRDRNIVTGTTPTSASKLQFETPAFLKRHSLPAVKEGDAFDAPVSSLRLPGKPFARGLSEIVAGLRKVEEEKLDEDLEALREMEAEEMGSSVPKPLAKAAQQNEDEVLAPDSQAYMLPLGGFDDEGKYDSPTEGGEVSSMRIFKKKGPKRTTRKVNMRPTKNMRPANLAEERDGGDDEGEILAAETRQTGVDEQGPELDKPDTDDSEFDGAENKSKDKKKIPKKEEGTLRKRVRKVNALAHANFQRLKLKNYGAKGGPRHNSRFRRRR